VDEAAEVTDQRFEAGTAFLDPFLKRLVPSPHEAATFHPGLFRERSGSSGSIGRSGHSLGIEDV
jgi:hypothetical protein